MISIVPIPFNFYEVEIGAIPTTIYAKKFKVGIGSGIITNGEEGSR
jgi:hypothetical protein